MKFSIIGSSCAGKTTLTHAVVSRLKSYGVLADGVYSQDRKFSFPISKIETEAAQNWMVANMIAKEADLELHTDVDVLVSDRSPLDLIAYYAYQYDTPLSAAALLYAVQWCRTYEALYYLEPLPYQDDTKRPPDDFRLGVDKLLRDVLLPAAQNAGVNVMCVERHKVLQDIMKRAKVVKPAVKSVLTPDDVQRLSNFLGLEILAKFPAPDADTLSDTDLWVIYPDLKPYNTVGTINDITASATAYLRGHVGQWPNFDIMVTNTAAGLPPAHHFTPSK